MKKSWYFQSWFLCILFSLWFFIIPGIIGIILLIFSIKDDIKRNQETGNNMNNLKEQNEDLNRTIKEMGLMDAVQLQEKMRSLEKEIDILMQKKDDCTNQLDIENEKLLELNKQLVETEEEILLQTFGLYKPRYEFANSDKYRAELEKIRTQQKDLIKSGDAATGNMNWTVNGSSSQGKKMVKDMQKLLIRAFNSECEEVIDRVKYNNYDSSLKRITSSYDAVSNLGKIMSVAITKAYYDLKIEELTLALEYQQKKQQEKEEQKLIREQMREEEKLRREIEEARRKVEKEQSHYLNALSKITNQLETANEEQKSELLAKKQEIENQLLDIDKAIKDIDYRQANQRAGYVYIISNIGSFGENIFKIGMTRRLNPEERVDELGDASVPFDFDIHAMIFCDDAPALENALHNAFEHKKLNLINQRREFFNVTIEEIKAVINSNYDKTVEFIEMPEAEQFRISTKMRQNLAS